MTSHVTRIVLATVLAIRGNAERACVLLVASRYANHPEPLWNLPGGRQQPGELLAETAQRECLEETGIRVRARELAYVSESYDERGTHVINATFYVTPLDDSPLVLPFDRGQRDHVVTAEWVPLSDVAARISVAVVREPLIACLQGRLGRRYAGFADAGITIEWPTDSA